MRKGDDAMFNFKRIYGEATIEKNQFENIEENATIKLQYYQTKDKGCKKNEKQEFVAEKFKFRMFR